MAASRPANIPLLTELEQEMGALFYPYKHTAPIVVPYGIEYRIEKWRIP
jgi:hypothetical protein